MDAQIPPPPPPPGATPDAEPVLIEMGRRRGRLLWAAAFVAVLAVIGAVVVLAGRGDDIDADAALRAAQAAVDDAGSYRFDLRTTTRTQSGDPTGAGSESTVRAVARGEVAADDRWSVTEEVSDLFMGTEGSTFETRRVEEQIYTNAGDGFPEGVGPQWTALPVGEPTTLDDYVDAYDLVDGTVEDLGGFGDDPSLRLDVLLGAYLLPVAEDPRHVERLVAESAEPAVEDRLPDGGVRLSAELPPIPEIAERAEDPVPPVTLTLELDEARLPTVVRFDVAVDGASEAVELRFRDWGAAIEVVAPGESEIDRTPWIEEERLAGLDPALLLAPTAVPADLELSSAYVYPGYDEDGSDDPDCPSVDLTYGREADSDFYDDLGPGDYDSEEVQAAIDAQPYLDVSISTVECTGDDSPFEEDLGGLPARATDEGYVEVLHDDLVVAVSSDHLTDDDVAAIVRSLRPVSVEELAALVPEWAREDATEGF